jgi:hypothetical protein
LSKYGQVLAIVFDFNAIFTDCFTDFGLFGVVLTDFGYVCAG